MHYIYFDNKMISNIISITNKVNETIFYFLQCTEYDNKRIYKKVDIKKSWYLFTKQTFKII